MPAQDRYGSGFTETVVASVARTTSGDSGPLTSGWAAVETLRAQINVTAAAGTTPTLNVVIEDSLDGTNWNTIGTFAQKTAVSREVINVTTPFAGRVRIRWTVGGTTPSFTFDVIAYTE